MRLTTTTQVSVDGVMQGPGGPEEDDRGVFDRGGWAHFDDEASTVMDEIYQRADVFLFGRRTYEVFAGSWGSWDDPGDSPIWTALTPGQSTWRRPHSPTRNGLPRPSSQETSRRLSAS